jgi:hypothetical protein
VHALKRREKTDLKIISGSPIQSRLKDMHPGERERPLRRPFGLPAPKTHHHDVRESTENNGEENSYRYKYMRRTAYHDDASTDLPTTTMSRDQEIKRARRNMVLDSKTRPPVSAPTTPLHTPHASISHQENSIGEFLYQTFLLSVLFGMLLTERASKGPSSWPPTSRSTGNPSVTDLMYSPDAPKRKKRNLTVDDILGEASGSHGRVPINGIPTKCTTPREEELAEEVEDEEEYEEEEGPRRAMVDYDSEEYFHQKLQELEQDISHGFSILRSKRFREALRINH